MYVFLNLFCAMAFPKYTFLLNMYQHTGSMIIWFQRCLISGSEIDQICTVPTGSIRQSARNQYPGPSLLRTLSFHCDTGTQVFQHNQAVQPTTWPVLEPNCASDDIPHSLTARPGYNRDPQMPWSLIQRLKPRYAEQSCLQ